MIHAFWQNEGPVFLLLTIEITFMYAVCNVKHIFQGCSFWGHDELISPTLRKHPYTMAQEFVTCKGCIFGFQFSTMLLLLWRKWSLEIHQGCTFILLALSGGVSEWVGGRASGCVWLTGSERHDAYEDSFVTNGILKQGSAMLIPQHLFVAV